jgi:hypothetical protein
MLTYITTKKKTKRKTITEYTSYITSFTEIKPIKFVCQVVHAFVEEDII